MEDGVCGVLIADKLGVSQPTASEHLKILAQAGLVRSKRINDEVSIREMKQTILKTI